LISQATIARYFGSVGDVHTPGKVFANDTVEVLVAATFPRSVGGRQGFPVRASRTPGEDVVGVFAHGVEGAGDVESVLGGDSQGRRGEVAHRSRADRAVAGRSARCARFWAGRPISRSMFCPGRATEPGRRKGKS